MLRDVRLSVSLLCLALFSAGDSVLAETIEVGPDEIRAEHRLSESDRTAVFIVDRLCYGSNAPTTASRHVIRFYNAAAAGFLRASPDADGPAWIGHRIVGIREAFARAAPLLPRRINLSDAAQVRTVAEAELALGQRSVEEVFPPAIRRPDGNTFRISVPGPGARRTFAVRGCYREDDLKRILQLRSEAAERLLAAAGGAG